MSESIRRLLVAYDVTDDARRDRLATLLLEHGERVQYSVFLVDGRPASFVRLRDRVRRTIDPAADSVMLVDLGPREHARDVTTVYLGCRRSLLADEDSLII